MKPDIWFIDIDGCLSAGKFKRFNLSAFRDLEDLIRAKNLKVVICTGRSLSYVEALHQVFDWGDFAICDHGSLLYDLKNEVVHAHSIFNKAMREKVTQLSAYFATAGENNGHWTLSHGKTASISLVGRGEHNALSLHDIVKSAYETQDFDLHASGKVLDIVPARINKWQGAQFYLKHLNIDKSYVLGAIGDSHGDLPLLAKVDVAACPANAHQDVKALCNYCSKEIDILGVLEILSQESF